MIRFSKIEHNVRELFPKLSDYFSTRMDVEFAYLFGSYGLGKEGPMSDVDVAVYLNKRITKEQYFGVRLQLISDIAQILKTDEVDVAILNQVDMVFAYHIVSSRKVLFERDPAERVEYEVRVLDRYFDSAPIRKIQLEYFKKHVEEGKIFG